MFLNAPYKPSAESTKQKIFLEESAIICKAGKSSIKDNSKHLVAGLNCINMYMYLY